MMLANAASIWLLTYAESFPAILLAALGIGQAGGTLITSITFTSIAPRVMGEQIGAGSPQYAMYGCAVFYALSLAVNWWIYLRRGAEIYNP